MGKKDEVIVILELVTEREGTRFLKFILYIAHKTFVTVHVHRLVACSDR